MYFTKMQQDLIVYCLEQCSSDFTDEEQSDFESIIMKFSLSPPQSPPCEYEQVLEYSQASPQYL